MANVESFLSTSGKGESFEKMSRLIDARVYVLLSFSHWLLVVSLEKKPML